MGSPLTDTGGASQCMSRGEPGADGREDHVCMRASKWKDRGRESPPWSPMMGALRV